MRPHTMPLLSTITSMPTWVAAPLVQQVCAALRSLRSFLHGDNCKCSLGVLA